MEMGVHHELFTYQGLVRLMVERTAYRADRCRPRKRGNAPWITGRATVLTFAPLRLCVRFFCSFIRVYSCAFAVVFSLSTVIGVPASPA
jgi:hypothetical protein